MDLREFIDNVKTLGELKVIEGAHWDLEIGAITYLVARKPKPPALLFDKIPGYKHGYRILSLPINSENRQCLQMGLPTGLKGAERIQAILNKMNRSMKLIPPVEVKKGPIMQNIYRGDEVDLSIFPTPKWLAGDGGRYIGLGDTVIMKEPDEGWINVGTHRIQVHDKTTATIFFEAGKHGDMIRRKYWSRGQGCPVAVTLGGDPYHISIAGHRSTWGVPEFDYIGWWQDKPVEVIKGPVTGLPIPADAEIAFEGEMVPPEIESRMEGPFSEWTGHYSPPRPESAFKVKCVLHRDDPIILAMLPFLGTDVARPRPDLELWHHLQNIVPGVKGVWAQPVFGGPHATVISITQKYGGHAMQTALAALAFWNYQKKFIIIVDDDIDPSNLNEVMFAVGMRSDPEKWEIIKGCWDGTLDPLIPPEKRAMGDITEAAAIILACKPYHWMKDFPARVKTDPELEKKVREKWQDL
jgi:UbiD family decarboxylase